MSRGVNRVTIIGNCGNDPETRFLPNGGAVCNVSIATSEEWTDKQTNEKQTRTEWHRVVFMDRGNFRLGQIAGEYIRKGTQVYVEGRLQTREWEKDGIKRYSTEIIASEMQLLSSKQDSNEQPQQSDQGGFNQPAQQPQDGGFGGFGQQAQSPTDATYKMLMASINDCKTESELQEVYQTALKQLSSEETQKIGNACQVRLNALSK